MERLSDLQGRVRKAREELGMTTGKARTECDVRKRERERDLGLAASSSKSPFIFVSLSSPRPISLPILFLPFLPPPPRCPLVP